MASTLWGLMGVSIGPGIMMLIVGVIIGFAGAVFSIICEVSRQKIGIFLSGHIVSAISVVLILLIFQNTNLTINGNIFLFLFVVIPSYLIPYVLPEVHHD